MERERITDKIYEKQKKNHKEVIPDYDLSYFSLL
jgi:hypothetical protein